MENKQKNVSWYTPSALTAYPVCKKTKLSWEAPVYWQPVAFQVTFSKTLSKARSHKLVGLFSLIISCSGGFYNGPTTFKLRSDEPPTCRSLVTETWRKRPGSFVFELCLQSLERGFENVTSNGINCTQLNEGWTVDFEWDRLPHLRDRLSHLIVTVYRTSKSFPFESDSLRIESHFQMG